MFSESAEPLPWDKENAYTRDAIELYYEMKLNLPLTGSDQLVILINSVIFQQLILYLDGEDGMPEISSTGHPQLANVRPTSSKPLKYTSSGLPKPKGCEGQVKTIYIPGFRSSDAYDNIKIALVKHFEKCGDITRVDVLNDHESGALKGFCRVAFIDFAGNNEFRKALQLNGSELGGSKLIVEKAKKGEVKDLNMGMVMAGGLKKVAFLVVGAVENMAQECFDPIVAKSGRDLIPVMVNGKRIPGTKDPKVRSNGRYRGDSERRRVIYVHCVSDTPVSCEYFAYSAFLLIECS
ncbi:Nucleotide-binding, alpha-beta plait [Artemisia annua]|uniref:Nucleotide-binding, alpha-beta plait n=1 Tax=Artemisia annua TaxID=35608 RepID=A0A2U1PAV5_ARTAN|nr:Nucleotide-binding, alpha-beta plait [Artemisia annua]